MPPFSSIHHNLDALSWHLRRMLCPIRHPCPPDRWVMNLEAHRHQRPLDFDDTLRLQTLQARFPIEAFLRPAWQWVRLESYFVLDQLARVLECLPPDFTLPQATPPNWVDVGAKNMGYLPALLAAGASLNRGEPLHTYGLELDPYRRYIDGHTRGEYGLGMAQAFPELAQFHPLSLEDYLNRSEGATQAAVVSCFLPFVLNETHRAWGLPQRCFQPDAFLRQMVQLLAPGGLLILSNLSEAEVQAQCGVLAPFLNTGELMLHCEALTHPTRFLRVDEDTRFLWLLQKAPA